jgi:two-component system sensor histidine kinase PilS (NtrC family)
MTILSAQSSLPEAGTDDPADTAWRSLAVFFSYRLLLAVLLIYLYYYGPPARLLGRSAPELYSLTSIVYLGMVLASGVLLLRRLPAAELQAAMMLFVDVAAITLLMHASGGVQTGLGMLLAVSIAAGSLLLAGPTALLFAALATLAILAEQVFTDFNRAGATVAYPQAGLLGASFFAIAVLAHVLSRRLSRSEQLVSQQELDLANLEQLNSYVVQHMETGILVVDQTGDIRLCNESAWYLLGMPDAHTGDPLERASQQLADQLRKHNGNDRAEAQFFRPVAGGRELQASFSPLGNKGRGGSVVIIEDTASITQRAQQIKLASLGRLTASIAHEIRNPLGAISHAQQLLGETPGLNAGERRLIEIIRSNSERVNGIVENVLQLSRRTPTRPEQIQLQPWLKHLLYEFAENEQIDHQQVVLQITPVDTWVRADPVQLRQIVINLCENAVRHFDAELQELTVRVAGGVTRESGGPFIDIMDNGPGIKADVGRQIFEPFFTTRNTGTGLGLYIARELSESNRINLEYMSLPAGGSCFRISFPNPSDGMI